MPLKQQIQKIIFPLGSIQRIRIGHLRGLRIRISDNSLWSPLMGRYEPIVQKVMKGVVRPGDVVYDLGANNGLHGLLMARLVGEAGWVFNFEPLQENLKEIEENFRLNGLTRFKNVQAAVSGMDGVEYFKVEGHRKQGALSAVNSGDSLTFEVKTITLDSFIREGNPAPAFMKVDIEGAEGAALDGAAQTISRHHPVMIIELHSPEQDRKVGKFLKEHDYSIYRFDPYGKLAFKEITDMTKSYPDPDAIWGTVLCLPSGTKLDDYHFDQ